MRNETAEAMCQPVFGPDRFKSWNSSSLSHLRLIASGVYGPVATDLARNLYRDYIGWATSHPEDYGCGFMGRAPPIARENHVLDGLVRLDALAQSLNLTSDQAKHQLFAPEPHDWEDAPIAPFRTAFFVLLEEAKEFFPMDEDVRRGLPSSPQETDKDSVSSA